MRRPLVSVAIHAAALFVLLAGFAVLRPAGSGPDEPSHIEHAAGVVRGELSGLHPRIPAPLAQLDRVLYCFHYRDRIRRYCPPRPVAADRDVPAHNTYTGNYDPIYYAWTGWPTLLVRDTGAVVWMRLLSAATTAILAGWALSLTRRRATSRWPVLAILVALAPETVIVLSFVNPSGWEIAGAIGFVTGLRLSLEAQRWGEPQSLAAVAGAMMAISRTLSPEYAVLVALLVLGVFAPAVRVVLRPPLRTVLLTVLVVAAAGELWSLAVPPMFAGVVPTPNLRAGMVGVGRYLRPANLWDQMLSATLWEHMPAGASAPIVVAFSGFVVLAWRSGSRRQRFVLMAGSLLVLIFPAVMAGMFWSGDGWQGRYTVPLADTCLLAAGWILDEVGHPPRWLRIAIPAAWTAETLLLAAMTVVDYANGFLSLWFVPPRHSPPAGWILPCSLVLAGTLATGIAAARSQSPRR